MKSHANISLATGGPFFRLLQHAQICGEDLEHLRRRLAVAFVLAWLPLFIFSLVEGSAWGGRGVYFLGDFETQVRFLVAMPMLFLAEILVHRRWPAMAQFAQRELVVEPEKFDQVMSSARAWLESRWLEIALLVGVYSVGVFGVWRHAVALETTTWYGQLSADGHLLLTGAGHWLELVSIPLFQFLLLRWYLRLLVWWRLLWQISRLELSLQPLHPDHSGGLGFLAELTKAFVPLLIAHGALAAGWIANQIFYAAASLPQFGMELAAAAVFLPALVLGPLLAFTPQLMRARRAGLGAYGNLASNYARDFNRKWLSGSAPAEETVIGSADIQSLADLGNSYATLKDMRSVLFNVRTALPLALAVLAPISPLLLTMLSAEEIISSLLKMIF